MRAFGGWKTGEYSPEIAAEIARSGCCKRLTAALLSSRGIKTPKEAKEFLRDDMALLHDPFLMKDMDKAVERIRLAVDHNETVAVYGDYDVDGLTSSAVITSWLRHRGLKCTTYIPERLTEGYGISDDALRQLREFGATLIITVDCGVTAIEQVKTARELGMDVVITDHHECQCDIPDAVAVVDPHRKDCAYPFKGLAGVGVAFKLICALEGKAALRRTMERYGALAAMGTIADIMPVTGENRVIIRQGITMLRTRPMPGLDSLMNAINMDKRRICGTDISFSVIPKLNAAGRMGKVSAAFRLLMSEEEAESAGIAAELCEMNAERRSVETRVFNEAIEMMGDARNVEVPIVLASENWHHGVSGIVASRLAERYGVPAIIICLEGDEGRGSCRSYGGFRIFEALDTASDLLTTFGGHAMAAGLTVPRENIEALRNRMTEVYLSTESERMQPSIPVDFCVDDLSLLTLEEIQGLKSMSPWGVGNPPPLLCLRDMKLETLIPIGNDKHLKMQISKGGKSFECVFFGLSVRELGIKAGSYIDLAFEPGINEFRGSRTVQLLLRDVRPARRKNDASLSAAKRFLNGERVNPMEKAMIKPDRSELGRVWRYLCRRARRFAETEDTLLPEISLRSAVLPVGRVLICLHVFDELKLLRLKLNEEGELEIYIPRIEGKVDLNRSMLLKQLG